MSRRILFPLAAVAAALATAAGAQLPVNPIHPAFPPLDAAGKPARTGQEVSAEKTCGACHDVAYIDAHSGHAAAKVKASCVQCHLEGGRLEVSAAVLEPDGRLKRDAIRIGAPRASHCGACHGVVSDGSGPVALPADFEAASASGAAAAAGVAAGGSSAVVLPASFAPAPAAGTTRSWSLTQGEGAIVAPQRMADSFLNLAGKAELAAPWDVHAAKLVDCVACHYAANNPARTDAKHESLRYLSADPRRPATAEFLHRPDHRLAEQGCRGCHDPMKAHEFLPYRSRHMAALSCQACHASGAMGPAAEMVDATVARRDGTPAIRYRNVERRPGEALNAALVKPFRPLLVERVESDGQRRVAPVNPVSRWRWVSGPDRIEVPFERVAQAYVEGGRWAPAVLEAFDADRDGDLSEAELRLDTRKKTDLVANRLRALGVVDPVVEGTLEVHPLAHGISTRDRALRDCSACHAQDSRLSDDGYLLAAYLPGGVPPAPSEKGRVDLAGMIAPTSGGGLALRDTPGRIADGLHVLGHSREGLTNTLGFWLFVLVFAGVSVHGLARIVLRKRRAAHAPPPGPKAYVFGRYERLWHWTMALAGVLLILTGLDLHGGEGRRLMGLPAAVALHNAFAVILMLNGFLALFYHLTTKAIRNFIPHPHGLTARILEHMSYQARGIFYGESHPPNAPGHKLNPLQQLTYLALLNVLFPLQFVTGALIWAVGWWPQVAAALHGLQIVAPLHNAGAWVFLSFFVLHVYLVTTGRTPSDHLESMITGYQHLEPEEPTP